MFPLLTKNLAYVYLVCSICSFSFGYTLGFSSFTIPALQLTMSFDDEWASWFSSLMSIGSIIGIVLSSIITEKLGRKMGIVMTLFFAVLGWICFLFEKVNFLYAGRLLTGMSSGFMMMVVPTLIVETSPKELRGRAGYSSQVSICIGTMAAFSGATFIDAKYSCVPPLILTLIGFFLSFTIPESPRFLLQYGLKTKARASLLWLRGPGQGSMDEEFEDIDLTERSNTGISRIGWLFTQPFLRMVSLIGVMLMVVQQLTGINVMLFNALSLYTQVFENSRNSTQAEYFKTLSQDDFLDDMAQKTVILSICQVVATMISFLMADNISRRKLLIFSGIGMSLSAMIMAAGNTTHNIHLFSFAFCLYMITFSMGWGPAPLLILPEMLPTRIRIKAAVLCISCSWSVSFFLLKFHNEFVKSIGLSSYFAVYGAFCLVGTLLVYRNVPETLGKSLETIERNLVAKSTTIK